ncbi:MAG TPA: hypothetical protein VHM25_28625 [Polyangiaceae bacterium]|jgi:hypothetical protein|nr:hypothetical protein [Polyangiaceae bacterium]
MLSHDSVGEVTAAACAASAANVLKRLQARLAPLIGSAGMRALFARAVRLTGREFDMLSPLPAAVLDENVPAAEALAESLSRLDAVAAQAVATALYKNFLELTCSLIGEHLVLLVLQRAFPNIDVIAKQESE